LRKVVISQDLRKFSVKAYLEMFNISYNINYKTFLFLNIIVYQLIREFEKKKYL
jgi:hypothetical protein